MKRHKKIIELDSIENCHARRFVLVLAMPFSLLIAWVMILVAGVIDLITETVRTIGRELMLTAELFIDSGRRARRVFAHYWKR